MKIFGISGTNGSGKDSLGIMLAEKYGYLFVSVTEILRSEAIRRGLPVEREVLRTISAEWRRESGLGVLIDKSVELFNAEPGKYAGLAIASLRNDGEGKRVHELGGLVVWIDADPKVRYNRIHSRQRSNEDQKTFDQFLAEEQAEMYRSGDAATLNTASLKDQSDIVIVNDSDSVDEFVYHAKDVLKLT